MKVAGTRRVPSADVMFSSDQRRVQATLRRIGRRADGTRRVPATLRAVNDYEFAAETVGSANPNSLNS